MAFTPEDIRANRDFFAEKLNSEKQRNDVLKAAEGKSAYDFVLLDTRGREAFSAGHIPARGASLSRTSSTPCRSCRRTKRS
jgi:hypothetical protein